MGLMKKFSKLKGNSESNPTGTIKGPVATIRELGIDTSDLKFSLNQDGTVNITGYVRDQSDCDRICQLIKAMPGIVGVKNKLIVGDCESDPEQAI